MLSLVALSNLESWMPRTGHGALAYPVALNNLRYAQPHGPPWQETCFVPAVRKQASWRIVPDDYPIEHGSAAKFDIRFSDSSYNSRRHRLRLSSTALLK